MIRFSRIYFLSGLLLIGNILFAQSLVGRKSFSVNDGWRFTLQGKAYAETVAFDDSDWQPVSFPHSWNVSDPFDNDRTYTRGIGWYRKNLTLDAGYKNKKVYLYFEGANQVTQVYVNGSFAGLHKGGYTGFSIDITPYLNWKGNSSQNTIAVQVNNAHDPFVAPLNVGYASYGGIYRDAWIIATNPVHFKDINNNSSGVYISTPSVSRQESTVSARTIVSNESASSQTVRFVNKIYDAKGVLVTSFENSTTIAAGQHKEIKILSESIRNPQLWSPSVPYLYKVVSSLIVDGKVLDEVENHLGFRWFSFSADNGFFLNGEKLVLRGTNRHQDMKGKADALTLSDHRRDMQLIKDMGCNFLRLAHYPQSAYVLNLADELGLIVWEEIPVVNFVTRHEEFIANSQSMLHEMISQGFNHPSVVMWGSCNEVLLHGPDGERIGKHNDTAYLSVVKKYVTSLDSMIRAEDPSRYSTMAMHISPDYEKYGLDIIPQVAAYNIYSGWYSGKTEDFGEDMDSRKRAGQPVFISEYGAEGEVRLNAENPVRMDYTGQYQRYYHESYLRQINQRPWLSGTAIWNEFDFSQPNIGGPAKHMNQKGLVTWDRKPKDAYYFYKANWNPEPMVYIASRDWLIRAGERTAASTIDVYSNGKEVGLTINGVKQKNQTVNDMKKASWKVNFKDGLNTVVATSNINGKAVSDQVVITYKAYNAKLTTLPNPLCVNVGSAAQYADPAGNIWIEDREYQKGSFGYVGGKAKNFDRKDPIMHTQDEPMYYSYMDSLSAYKFDVPDGQYRVTLFMAEPSKIGVGERVFSVKVNGETVAKDIDLKKEYGFAEAASKSFVAKAANGNGIEIKFEFIKGNAVLNGIAIERYP